MDTKKLTLIVNGQKQETFEIDAFEVSYGLYEETDIAVIIHTVQEELVAEGVGRPSSKGIQEEIPLETVKLMETAFANAYMGLRAEYFSKVLLEISPEFSFVEKRLITTKSYTENRMSEALEEFAFLEKELSEKNYMKIIKEPIISFTTGSVIIVEEIELYKKVDQIEEAKVKEIDNG